ncbi:hypothetical protein TNCV_3148921 [Trichonephila clavipes]|nr:hypothetical protein TNCV_3148921 [Trichonephila clavipes]
MSSLVVRASDSRPESLGWMPVPSNILRVHTDYVLVKPVGTKVLWTVAAETTVQVVGEYFQFHALIGEVEIGGVAIYRVEVQPVSGSGNVHSFPSGRTQQLQRLFIRKSMLLVVTVVQWSWSGTCDHNC